MYIRYHWLFSTCRYGILTISMKAFSTPSKLHKVQCSQSQCQVWLDLLHVKVMLRLS